MPLSRRTLEEMEAGARQVVKNEGREDLPPDHMEKVLNTHARYAQLQQWQRDGVLAFRRQRVSDQEKGPYIVSEVWVGDNLFQDREAEKQGTWPTELLFAQIALAVAAGQSGKER